MKVGLLVHNPPFQGGIVQYCILLANEMKKFATVDAVGFKKLYPPFLYKGKLPKKSTSGIQFDVPCVASVTWYNPLSWVGAYLRLRKNDVIHIQWVSPLLTPLQYVILQLNRWFAKKPIVMTCHNIEPHESTIFDKVFTRLIFSYVDHFIVHAEQNRTRLERDYGIPSPRVHVVRHGTFGYFRRWKTKPKKELLADAGLTGKKVILFFGYIREYKGLRYLIRAMPKILQDHKDAVLVVAGELWQQWKTYEGELVAAGVKDKVKVYPKFIADKDVHKFFDLADVVVLPYHNTEQTISGPLLVSLAFAKPTVVAVTGGIAEMIQDGKNGLLVQGGDSSVLAEKIGMLLKDPQLQRKIGAAALKTSDKFAWDKVAEEIYAVYRGAL